MMQKKKFLEADMAVKNYKKPQDSIIAEFLSEMLKVNPQEKILENKISELNDAVISLGENTNIVSNYSDLVKRTQNLTVIVDAYIKLSEAVPNDRTNIEEDGMDTAEEDVNVVEDEMGIVEEKVTDDKENIIVPDPESKDFEQEYTAWKDFWIKKLMNWKC